MVASSSGTLEGAAADGVPGYFGEEPFAWFSQDARLA